MSDDVYLKLVYARQLRNVMLKKFNLHSNKDLLIAFRDFLGISKRNVIPIADSDWTSYLLIEVVASDELIQKLEALAGPYGHTYYKALVARGVLPALKNSPVV